LRLTGTTEFRQPPLLKDWTTNGRWTLLLENSGERGAVKANDRMGPAFG
jgi:hypothetical protein